MTAILHIETISDLNRLLNQETPKHPLVTVVDFSKVSDFGEETIKMTSGFYSVMLKNNCHGKLKYGRAYFDFQEGTLICIAPQQVATIENETNEPEPIVGWGLFFHPDLIRRTSLGSKINDYTFFSYEANEALHLSTKEKHVLNDCIANIEQELSENIDDHSQLLIVSNIELLLNYCLRYYDRQFITRKNSNRDVLSKFESALGDYFHPGKTEKSGLPTVNYLAEKLHLSPNYLSDLLKKETGKNAQEQIHAFIIEEAKNRLLNSEAGVGEIAFQLGFEYPQYFSKLFKNKTGMTPAEYRGMN